ncbi:hypothetical protein E9M_03304 [Moraxella catarrhalis 46P47B1]|nr:hypothetical protein E9M_03304 [Moraxella catarrhalis 46P47B1]EGE14969.1 hypothetical protein E9O_06016 [Moraxella catarrhalis 12P80B1]EGE19050.1 hypothetical protein E9Q_03103 [Moraxella catarrhalis BC1]EGE19342.1 hypothetical protein E9S_07225 [Moraxella catarrhalis BC7]EGE25394.1 hypothetical protein E9Y_03361 [Moraxella catarrhalis 101P30B1]
MSINTNHKKPQVLACGFLYAIIAYFPMVILVTAMLS